MRDRRTRLLGLLTGWEEYTYELKEANAIADLYQRVGAMETVDDVAFGDIMVSIMEILGE